MIDARDPEISIVIPAYNEERRLPVFLRDVVTFTSNSSKRYEIIVVDDGSRDRTQAEAGKFSEKYDGVRVIRLDQNRGKGYAVKSGLFKARAPVHVFLDADGSVHPREIEKNLPYLDEGYDVVIGSRVKRAQGQVLKRKWWRVAIGIIFNFMVKQILGIPFLDTQCGFKMFRAHVVKPVFSRIYLMGFGFDIELMFLIDKCGYRAIEVPVSWEHRAGSKVNLWWDSLVMFVNILQVRNWHWTPINKKDKYLGPREYAFMRKMEEEHWWFTSRRKVLENP